MPRPQRPSSPGLSDTSSPPPHYSGVVHSLSWAVAEEAQLHGLSPGPGSPSASWESEWSGSFKA